MSRPGAILAAVALAGVLCVPSSALAGAWTQPEGTVWSKLSLWHVDSDRIFVDSVRAGDTCNGVMLEPGDRAPYDCQLEGGGGLKTTQLFFDLFFGLHDRIDLRLQVQGIANGEFKSEFVTENERGLGDIRFGTQVLLLREPVVAAVNLRAKAPTGDFTTDAVGFSLGEGQWDLLSRGLLSKSFLDGKIWAGVEAGYRARFDNDSADLNVGDEILAIGDVGGWPSEWTYLQLRTKMVWGFTTTRTGGPISAQPVWERRYVLLEPKIMIAPLRHIDAEFKHHFRDLGVEWGVRVPVWGRNWPADPMWFVGISSAFRVFEPYSGDEG